MKATMKTKCSTSRGPGLPWCLALGGIFIFGLIFGASAAERQITPGVPGAGGEKPRPALQAKDDRAITIDMNDVDITVFIKFISELTGKNFAIDSRVRGKVNIISNSRISVSEAYRIFESVLEIYGFAAVDAGEVTKIVPATEARTKNIETRLKEEYPDQDAKHDDKIITQLIQLKYADPNEVKRLLTPLVSKSSVLLSYDPTNMIIVTDIHSNIQRLNEIIERIDIPGIGRQISVIGLKYADAQTVVKILSSMFNTNTRSVRKPESGRDLELVADERTNAVIVLASEDYVSKIKELIALLDTEVPKGKERIHVHYLENAIAEDLVKVLHEIPTQANEKDPKTPVKTAPILSSDIKITADKATNSLIIMADKDEYQALAEIIDKLDIPRSMVYIECLIMEVSVEKDFSLGTEWMAADDVNYNNVDGVVGGGFEGGNSGLSYDSLGNAVLPTGFSLGVFSETLEVSGILFPNLSAMIQAYKKDKDVNILSTPQILTTDNEEANIYVGKNVPYQTKSGSTTSGESYNTYEYKDVGINLKITPNISKDRMVRLNISQEVTQLDELSSTGERPTTLKRTIDTTVIVDDANTVVIGGLIDDSFSETEYKVPCLGDVPLVRYLFSTISESSEKTNLFVFLTPHVIQHPMEAARIYREKKAQIEKVREGAVKLYPDKDKPEKPLKPLTPLPQPPPLPQSPQD